MEKNYVMGILLLVVKMEDNKMGGHLARKWQ